MAGFIDVILRGAILVFASLVLGGVVWTRWVLRAEPHAKPAPATALALRGVALAAAAAAVAQTSTLLVALSEVGGVAGPEGWPLGAFFATTFARAAVLRVALALAIGVLAVTLARRAAGPVAWNALGGLALAFVVTSAVLSHAVARVESRATLIVLDALHQVAAAVWIGGLAHLTLWAVRRGDEAPPAAGAALLKRFSNLALASVITLLVAGVVLSWLYVGDLAAYVGTAYGVMVLSKAILLAAILALGAANPRAWPLGPAGFWESFTLPDVLQHRTFVLLVVAFGLFEWMVRTERLQHRPWGYVFPLLAAVGGGLLLTHSHAMFNLKTEFLSEVTHAPIGVLGAFCACPRPAGRRAGSRRSA